MDKERCKICGGTIFLDKENKKAYCEYCGTAVSLTPQMQDEIRGYEYEKKKKAEDDFATEQAKIQYERNEINFFNRSSLKIILIVLLVCVGVACLAELALKNPLAGTVSLIQTVLCIVALLCGTRIVRFKNKHITVILTVIVFVLIIPFCLFNNLDAEMKNTAKYKEKTLEWPSTGLAAMLPTPDFKYGSITHNGSDYIDADIYLASENEFKAYKEKCKESGFNDITNEDETIMYAYNSNNYYLTLYYYSYNDEFSIRIEAPESFDGFKWPKNNLLNLLPTPNADGSNVISDSADYCSIHIADYSLDDVESYIDECIDAGFTEDHSRESGYYYAYTKNGEKLTIKYDERQKIMEIYIHAKEDA